MGYAYKGTCLETLPEMLQRYAQDCTGQSFNAMTGTATSVPLTSFCTASATNVSIQMYDLKNFANYGSAITVNPPQYTCTFNAASSITNADAVQTAWLVIGVWVVAWGVRKMIDALRPNP